MICLTSVLIAMPAIGQTGRVLKAKGNKAIVQFEKGTEIYQGDRVSLKESDKYDLKKGRLGLFQNRNYALTYSWISAQSSGASSTMSHAGRIFFGWNMRQFEVGPTFSVSTVDVSSVKSQSIAVGARAKYNFTENTKDTEWVPAFYGELSFASATTSTSTASSSSSNSSYGAGFQIDWFLIGNNVALGGYLGLQQDKTSATTTNTTALGTSITLYF